MSTPHKCPVCEGRGFHSNDDLRPVDEPALKCHACNGKGVVWSPDVPWVPYEPMIPMVPWVAPAQPWPWWQPPPAMCVSPMSASGPTGEWTTANARRSTNA